MNIRMKYSPLFMGCVGILVGSLFFALVQGDMPSLWGWIFNSIVFSLFLLGGLYHGHLKWKKNELGRAFKDLNRALTEFDAITPGGRINVGFATPREYKEAEKQLTNHRERLYKAGNEAFERIEARRVLKR